MQKINWLTAGGWLMIPIYVCSFISVALILERFFSLKRARAYSSDLMDNVREILKHHRIDEAINLCDETGGPLGFVLKAGLLKHGRPQNEIRSALEDAGYLVIPSLERYLSALGTIANIAPLLGLARNHGRHYRGIRRDNDARRSCHANRPRAWNRNCVDNHGMGVNYSHSDGYSLQLFHGAS